MLHIEKAIQNIDREQLSYIGVNIYRIQDEFVLPFVQGTKYTFNPVGSSGVVVKDYNIPHIPYNILIDKSGKIAYDDFTVDAGNEKMLELMIRSLD
jgi:hypothetical protein